MQPKFGYKCKCKLFLDIFQGMRICHTLGFMTFVWHFLEACTGFIHYMFSLAYFPNLVWRNLAKNRTQEQSFTLSPMALNLKLLPVSFGVNMCETTLSHVQYVDDVWCMFSHGTFEIPLSRRHPLLIEALASSSTTGSSVKGRRRWHAIKCPSTARTKLTLVAKPLHSRCGLLLVSCPISDTIGHNFANRIWSRKKLRAHGTGTCERTLSKRHPMLFIDSLLRLHCADWSTDKFVCHWKQVSNFRKKGSSDKGRLGSMPGPKRPADAACECQTFKRTVKKVLNLQHRGWRPQVLWGKVTWFKASWHLLERSTAFIIETRKH